MTAADATVFIVDDDLAVLKALARQLTAAGYRVATFPSAQEFLNGYAQEHAGCLLLDVAMPGLDGLELQRRLTETGRNLPIVFITGHGDVRMTVQAMKNGAVDFLTKPILEAELIGVLREAIDRDASTRQARSELAEIERRIASLTPREHEVLKRVVAGKRNKQIAAELGTVEKTIKAYRGRVMEKMQASSLAELVLLAKRAGIATTSRLHSTKYRGARSPAD